MADGTDNIKREIVLLSAKEKISIAREVVRGLDPAERDDFVSEFREASPELQEYRQRIVLIAVEFFSSFFALPSYT